MAKLILTMGDRVVGEYALNKECLTIGRKPDNDIQIDNLAVSGHHAQIITILNDSFLEDLNSTNGTFVNSKSIKKHALSDGDVIAIGKHQLKYVNELTAKKGGNEDFEKTMIIRPDAAGMPVNAGEGQLSAESVGMLKAEHEEATKAAKAAPVTEATSAKLQILSGANTGKELALTKALTTLGKPGVQVAAITRRPQGFFLIHVEGGADERHPLVNGDPVGSQAQILKDHDIIEVAGVKMEFFLEH